MVLSTLLIYLQEIHLRITLPLPKLLTELLNTCVESLLEPFTKRAVSKAWDEDFKKKNWSKDEAMQKAYESWYRSMPFNKDYHSKPWEDSVLSLLKRFVPIGGVVLDAGCGSGDLSLKIADAGYKVIALDISKFQLEKLRRRIKANQKVTLTSGYLEHMDAVPTKSVDAVVCTHSLEHVRNLNKTMSEINRVARRLVTIVVPLQNQQESTPDYHLQFFPDVESFLRKTGLNKHKCHIHYKKLLYKGEILVYYTV